MELTVPQALVLGMVLAGACAWVAAWVAQIPPAILVRGGRSGNRDGEELKDRTADEVTERAVRQVEQRHVHLLMVDLAQLAKAQRIEALQAKRRRRDLDRAIARAERTRGRVVH
ncbi:MAG TPA: hypothetical protein VNL98_07090 [Gemmatimonadales bacterium]|nr:hypothetical protein [Gemmatimonadales bacterium]